MKIKSNFTIESAAEKLRKELSSHITVTVRKNLIDSNKKWLDIDKDAFVVYLPHAVGKLCAVVDEPAAHPDQHQRRLLIGGLCRHETHRRSAHRLAQRLGIRCVILAALHIRLRQLRRDQLHLMPERPEQTRPMMRSSTGFDCYRRRCQRLEKSNHLATCQLFAQHRLLCRIHSMQLNTRFDVSIPIRVIFSTDGLPRLSPSTNSLWHIAMPLGAVQPNTSPVADFMFNDAILTANDPWSLWP